VRGKNGGEEDTERRSGGSGNERGDRGRWKRGGVELSREMKAEKKMLERAVSLKIGTRCQSRVDFYSELDIQIDIKI